jgi:type IV secretory pathway VirB2 component (pilin)
MSKDDMALLVGLGVVAVAGCALAATGMPWERPLETIANSITGKAGAGAATIGIAWAGVNWGRGAEHGKETFITTALATGLIFGSAKIVNEFGGGAGADPLVLTLALPWGTFLSDALGELLGYGAGLAWLWSALVAPWRLHRG